MTPPTGAGRNRSRLAVFAEPPPPGHSAHPRVVLLAALVDAAHVGFFALVGRSAHDEALTPAGWISTVWPFLVGMLAGYVGLHLLRREHSPASPLSGVAVWLWTAAGGLAIRSLVGQGTALAFVLVALTVLLVLLLAWRLVVALVLRRT